MDSVEVELVVVVRASEEQEAIAQSRCLGLTRWIYKNIQTRSDNAMQLLASLYSSATRLYCIVLYCIALHCIALHCIVLLYCIVTLVSPHLTAV